MSASLAPEENFSQDDPPVFGQRVVENSGVLKTVGYITVNKGYLICFYDITICLVCVS